MTSNSEPFVLEYRGICPICDGPATFRAEAPWLRESLMCTSCPNGSVPRERALALVLRETAPNWKDLQIHEAAPADRGISRVLRRDCRNYVESQYFPNQAAGVMVGGARNENLERQTFADASFDLVISLDVMEHVARPERAVAEIYRTLRPGGRYLCTFPIGPAQQHAVDPRIRLEADGRTTPIKEAQYHGNPIDPAGSLVTIDYGYDIHKRIAEWAPFDVRVYRFADRTHGILGELTDVVACWKI